MGDDADHKMRIASRAASSARRAEAGARRGPRGRGPSASCAAGGTGRAEPSPVRLPVPVGRRAIALASVAVLGGRPGAGGADPECEACSDSNSSLQAGDKAFRTTASGLKILDIRVGAGPAPVAGSTVVVDWVGYTSGYQAKRIDSTQNTDNQFVFKLGAGEAIPAFEEAIAGMKEGGLRRVEIPGELEEQLGYSFDKNLRYSVGPMPFTLGGRRALDFVLDNKTLKSFNKSILFDIRLNKIRAG